MQARERLFITADKTRLVREGDPKGAFLYAAPGDEIPDSAAEMFGVVDGMAPSRHASRAPQDEGGKRRKGGEDKSRKDGSDKNNPESDAGGGGASDPSAVLPDDLTKIHGIGAKTAATLAAAGIDSFATLAAIDAANPPEIEGLNPRAPWGDWVKAAADLVPPPPGGLTVTTLPKEN